MGVSRTFNGSVSNYLDTVDRFLFDGASAQCAWIRVASLTGEKVIFGNKHFQAGTSPPGGYRLVITGSSQLSIKWISGGSAWELSKPLIILGGASQDWLQVGLSLFVAVNITSTSPPPSAEFFVGLIPSGVVSLGTSSGGGVILSNSADKVFVGAVNNIGTPEEAFNGKLQRVGRWGGLNLTLAELKAVAVCGATPPFAASNTFFYEMTGASPEPNTGLGGGGATIVGSLPLGPDLCTGGSEAVAIPPGNPSIVSPGLPHFSGGPGGGLQIPTLSFDDGGPAHLDPTTGNARIVQAPDWGSMGIKGSRGGQKGGQLAQRQSGMYRGLDHLAAKLRGKRK